MLKYILQEPMPNELNNLLQKVTLNYLSYKRDVYNLKEATDEGKQKFKAEIGIGHNQYAAQMEKDNNCFNSYICKTKYE